MGRIRLLILWMLIILLVGIWFPAQVLGDDITGGCEKPKAAYYQPNVLARYEIQNRRLVLVNWVTNEDVRVIEGNLALNEWNILDYSPDCRYLMAQADSQRVIWDVVNPRRVAALQDNQLTPQTLWEISGQYLLLGGKRGGGYQVNLNTGVINPLDADSGYMFLVVGWNLPLNQFYTIRFDNTGYIQVRDLTTGQVLRELSGGFGVSGFAVSPDGRYLAAGGSYHIAAWDMLNLPDDGKWILKLFGDGRIRFADNHTLDVNGDYEWQYDLVTGTKHQIFRVPTRYFYDPTNTYALLNFQGDLYMDQVASDQRVFLRRGQRPLYDPYWDLERGQVLVVLQNSASASVFNAPDNLLSVFAFDIHTGAQVGWYPLPDHKRPASFTLSDDGSKLIVYSNESRHGGRENGEHSGLIVYDRASQVGVEVNVEDFAARSPDQIALSSDNRYLVIGRTTLRVWDLANLPATIEDRLPIYRHDGPSARIAAVRFIDGTTLETTDYYGVIQRWDLFIGAPIPVQ